MLIMPGEESVESGPRGDTDDTNPVSDTISDWPADAIPSEPPELSWAPGQAVAYSQRRVRRPLGQRPTRVSRNVGPIAMWLGVAAVCAIASAIVAAILLGSSNAMIGQTPVDFIVVLGAMAIALLLTLAAIILGTIGRLNPEGRRAAAMGRRIGCGIPLAFILLALVSAAVRGDVAEFVDVTAIFVFTFLTGFLIILIADAILGST